MSDSYPSLAGRAMVYGGCFTVVLSFSVFVAFGIAGLMFVTTGSNLSGLVPLVGLIGATIPFAVFVALRSARAEVSRVVAAFAGIVLGTVLVYRLFVSFVIGGSGTDSLSHGPSALLELAQMVLSPFGGAVLFVFVSLPLGTFLIVATVIWFARFAPDGKFPPRKGAGGTSGNET